MKNRPIKQFFRKYFSFLFLLTRAYKLMYSQKSWLVESGYNVSSKERKPCRRDGSPVPWMNYHIIDFLEERLNKEQSLFEYGSGFSTAFYAARVASVTSVENSREWYDLIKSNIPANATLLLETEREPYIQASQNAGGAFDLIVVDGRHRLECLEGALKALSDRGAVLLDDSHRERYKEAFTLMADQGFKHLNFKGIKPGSISAYQTTVFYRDGNCFGL